MGREQAENRVEFVHAAVGRDARVVLGDAAAVAEAGFALVAGFRVDAGEEDHEGGRLTLAQLPEHGPDALLGLASLTLPFALQTLEPLHRGKKPCRLRLAV